MLSGIQREHEQANMKYRLRKFPLIRLVLLYFIFFCQKKCILQQRYAI